MNSFLSKKLALFLGVGWGLEVLELEIMPHLFCAMHKWYLLCTCLPLSATDSRLQGLGAIG